MNMASCKRSYYIVRIGHFIECFNNNLYGIFSVMLASVFFPVDDPMTSLLSSYLAFFAGYVSRPIGAFLWGKIGDEKGRSVAFSRAIMLSGFPPLCIGLLPSYSSIGVMSGILVFVLRIIQGICFGAENAGVTLYVYENKKDKCLGFEACFATCFGVLGVMMSAFFAAALTAGWMPFWGWRVPFIVGGVIAISMCFFRNDFEETAEYKDNKSEPVSFSESMMALKKNSPKILLTSLLSGMALIPLYCLTVFGNFLFKEWGFTTAQSFCLNGLSLFLIILFMLLFGFLSKFIALRKQIIIGLLLLSVLPYIAFQFVSGSVITVYNIIAFIAILTFACTSISGYFLSYAAGFFSIKERYMCVAIGNNIGACFIGGMTPFICQHLTNTFGKSSPAIFISSMAIISLIALLCVENHNTDSLGKACKANQ